LSIHPILKRNIKPKCHKKKFHFSSYGFCLPNKGFPELIKAIDILHKNNFNCKLTLYTALYDSEISSLFYDRIINLVNNLNLGEIVNINPSFLSDHETIKNLSETDLVIFPYQQTNESVSGAIRQAISSLSPVAVTPLPIFDDVLDVVYKLPGHTPSLIASGLINWIEECYGNPMTVKETNWLKEHSFSRLASRLYLMLRSIEVND